jgi:hypothetical protein
MCVTMTFSKNIQTRGIIAHHSVPCHHPHHHASGGFIILMQLARHGIHHYQPLFAGLIVFFNWW